MGQVAGAAGAGGGEGQVGQGAGAAAVVGGGGQWRQGAGAAAVGDQLQVRRCATYVAWVQTLTLLIVEAGVLCAFVVKDHHR